jgi:hypothetical protein
MTALWPLGVAVAERAAEAQGPRQGVKGLGRITCRLLQDFGFALVKERSSLKVWVDLAKN